MFHTLRRLEEIFAANTSFAAFLGSQAQLVVWQDLKDPCFLRMFISLLSGEGILCKVARGYCRGYA